MLGPSCLTQLYFLPLAMRATATPTTLQPLPKKRGKADLWEKERSLSVRRTRIAKDGHKETLLEVKEEQALGKASTSATVLGHDCHHNAIHPRSATGVRIH